MTAKTKNSELTRIIKSMEALGYQVDSIKILPEGVFHAEPERCRVSIKASPLTGQGDPPVAIAQRVPSL